MNKIKNALWKNYSDVNDRVIVMDINDEKYGMLLDERDKLRNELIKIEQAELEFEARKYQNDSDVKAKDKQIKAEDDREKFSNMLTICTFAVSTGVSLYAIVKTFKFDQDSTVTSTLGKGILNGVIPKIFKR